MDEKLFRYIIDHQVEWRKMYEEQEREKRRVRTILNRRYKSKGNHTLEQIRRELANSPTLEFVPLDRVDSLFD